jgi:hypothetical protein
MEAQEYIKNKINDLIQLFPEMKFTYKHDIESEIHEIIAIPESEYNKESFEIEEIKLYDEFADKFPFEGIVINTPDEAIIDDKGKKGNSLLDFVRYMLNANPESIKDNDIVLFYYSTLYEDYVEFGKEISNLTEEEIREKLNKRFDYENK